MTNFPILSNEEKKELIDLANEAADRAREAILPYFRQNIDVSNKDEQAFDPVTDADKAAENAIRRVISLSRPHDGIWGEETGENASSTGFRWVIDPIDGTKNFINGNGNYGTLVSLCIDSIPVFGIINSPQLK